MSRVCLVILDSLGVGGAPDAAAYGDVGANTLGHIARACATGQAETGRSGPLCIPNLLSLGLGLAAKLATGSVPMGLETQTRIVGRYGCATAQSLGKDTLGGHFEMTGVVVQEPWGYFEAATKSVPQNLLECLIQTAGLPGVLGNCKASGTEIIARLGQEHIRTGQPIVYTSADSVLQIAAHEEYFGLERLFEVCGVARKLVNDLRIARVIARPFVGEDAATFTRTGNRRDFSLPAPGPTLLDQVCAAGGEVVAVGKVADIFAHRGVTQSIAATGHDQLMAVTLSAWDQAQKTSLVMTNFVDFDSVYGHRRDVAGYARALEAFDASLPQLLERIGDEDVLIVTADHGCDPTWVGTDHTRERVPILAFGPTVQPGNMGRRCLADIGASVAKVLGLPPLVTGSSFLTTTKLYPSRMA